MRFRSSIAVLLFVTTTPALAGRSLEEPASVRQIVKKTSPALVKKALGDAGAQEQCAEAVLRSPELNGMACRLVVFEAQKGKGALSTTKDIQERVTFAKEMWASANTIAGFEPLTKPPGLDEARFEAHRRACGGLVSAWDGLRGVPKSAAPNVRAAVDAALADAAYGEKTVGDAACDCTVKSLDFATAAGASMNVSAGLQGTLTSRGCFLDEKKIRAERGGPETRFQGRAKSFSEASSVEGQIVAYAKTRDVGLSRCRDKFLAKGTIDDKDGMEKCVCGEVQRWTFPKEKGRPELTVLLPVYDERLGVKVGVSAPGKVTKCGPLEGSLLN